MEKYFLTLLICFFALFSLEGQEEDQPESRISIEKPQETKNIPERLDHSFDPFLDQPQGETQNFQTKFMNMLFMLGLLIGLMIFASWILKRMMRTRQEQLNSTSAIRVLETRPLSPKAIVYLLDVMGQGIIVAESPSGVHLLSKIQLEEIDASDQSLNERKQSNI